MMTQTEQADGASKVVELKYGRALVAAKNLKAGTIVEQFQGPEVDYQQLSDFDKRYALNYLPSGSSEWRWMLPLSNARFANHSCNPNSVIGERLELIAIRDLKEGEEITFLYNNGNESDHWDPIWSFKCECGADKCQGMIDQYRPIDK
eukprot:jgi/Hompol1/6747/HPOL_001191-RA